MGIVIFIVIAFMLVVFGLTALLTKGFKKPKWSAYIPTIVCALAALIFFMRDGFYLLFAIAFGVATIIAGLIGMMIDN